MTRTIYNWSELLERYRGKSIQKEPAIKKWSDIGKPELIRKQKHLGPGYSNPTVISKPVDQNMVIESGSNPGKSEKNIENSTVKTKIKNLDFDSASPDDPDYQLQLPSRKISLAELLYDTRFQDTETIPALYGSKQAQQTKVQKLTERDTLLIDLLEQNLIK
ncbi:MAG: hypothetical protein KAJ51_00925 [Thermoplasmata archaeon]|nr:hypothetical protein [Thermoplasmata archaeon]